MSDLSERFYRDLPAKLEKWLNVFKDKLTKIHGGRASPALIDSILVDCYGGRVALKSVAHIASEGANTLLVTPYDASLAPGIDKALRQSDLGLNPTCSANLLRITLPTPTEERRKDWVKKIKAESEQTAIAMRGIRREVNENLKKAQKNKELTEDELRMAEKEVQKHLEIFLTELHALVRRKEEEILKI